MQSMANIHIVPYPISAASIVSTSSSSASPTHHVRGNNVDGQGDVMLSNRQKQVPLQNHEKYDQHNEKQNKINNKHARLTNSHYPFVGKNEMKANPIFLPNISGNINVVPQWKMILNYSFLSLVFVCGVFLIKKQDAFTQVVRATSANHAILVMLLTYAVVVFRPQLYFEYYARLFRLNPQRDLHRVTIFLIDTLLHLFPVVFTLMLQWTSSAQAIYSTYTVLLPLALLLLYALCAPIEAIYGPSVKKTLQTGSVYAAVAAYIIFMLLFKVVEVYSSKSA